MALTVGCEGGMYGHFWDFVLLCVLNLAEM